MRKQKRLEASVLDVRFSETARTGGMVGCQTLGAWCRVCRGMVAAFWLLWLKYQKEMT